MLSSNNTIDIFKRSLTVTVKSIGKSQDAEIKFVIENPSINRNEILSIIGSGFPPFGFPEFYDLCS